MHLFIIVVLLSMLNTFSYNSEINHYHDLKGLTKVSRAGIMIGEPYHNGIKIGIFFGIEDKDDGQED